MILRVQWNTRASLFFPCAPDSRGRWSTLSYAANKKSMPGFNDGRAFLTNMFKEAQALKFNVYRFFIQGDYSFLTTSAGEDAWAVSDPSVAVGGEWAVGDGWASWNKGVALRVLVAI